MGPIGVQEMFIIFLVALVLFGPKKLPELGRTLGRAITEFRRASNELKAQFESHLHELEREGQSIKSVVNSYTDVNVPSTYSYGNDDYARYDPEYNPYSGSNETNGSQPSTTSTTAIQDAHSQPEAAVAAEPVAQNSVPGAVARSAGNEPATSKAGAEVHSA
jgi:sec-independent protein translocase protein TatA